ncbi:hypothetical protein CDV31_009225 [Fusarium ambrosium]|uniref:DUF7924 domain-containing protein n=1 Tax=Fusarium ambrosium TaxID=131363 RepID=A0A428TW41_9HYPO|nr:hypothetical protein CDV31_009225 [Fusarium ambrosium]
MAPPSRPGSSMPPPPKAYGRGSANPSGSLAPGTPSGIKTSGGKTGSLVESPLYEDLNLAANNIYYRDRREPLPQHVANLVQRVQRERTSPTPSVSDVLADEGLAALERGAGEPTIEQYFQNHLVAQTPRNDPLKRSDKAPFQRHAVPNTGTQHRVSNPTPNVTSGYDLGAFTAAQKMQLGKTPNISAMNNEGMCFPFFILEFKGDGPSSNGSLVAMNGTEARLFISWKQQDLFNVQNVRSFALQEPDHFIEFRKYVRNIIDWGRDERLQSIQAALDTLIEEGRKVFSCYQRIFDQTEIKNMRHDDAAGIKEPTQIPKDPTTRPNRKSTSSLVRRGA